MKKDTWLVVVGAGRWQVHGIRCAQAAGLKILALDGDPSAPGLELAERGLVVDICNSDEVIDAISHTGISPSGVISFCSEAGMFAAALVREQYSLPGPNIELCDRLRDKEKQRECWTNAGSPVPTWCIAQTESDALHALDEVGIPLILKPVDAAGSRGVTRVDSRSELYDAFLKAMSHSKRGAVIVESYIVGTEYTVESFTQNGSTHILLVTRKKKVIGTRDTVASELSSVDPRSDLFAKLASVTQSALSALGYSDGPGHTEIIIGSDGEAVLVESAGRGGGFGLSDEMVPLTSGFDITTASALQAVGHEVKPPPTHPNRFGILRFVPSQIGTVVGIHGFGQVSLGHEVHAIPLVKVGQKCERANSDGDRMAYILVAADTEEEAVRLANHAETSIHFEMSTNEQPKDNRHALAFG